MTCDPFCFASPSFAFSSRRSPVFFASGAVGATQPLAVEAGLSMLRRGGTAADAAVAVASTLAVTEPASTGPGGDAFALYYEAATGRVHGLNGSGRSPAALDFDLLRSRGLEALPPRSALSVTVPGGVGAWFALLERFGTLAPRAVLGPAVRYADEGFPVGPVSAWLWKRGAGEILNTAPGGASLLPGGRAPRAGEIVRNPALARTLAALGDAGDPTRATKAFYQGDIAARMARAVRDAGGVLAEDDLAAYEPLWDEPVSTAYRGLRIHECAPNGQGLAALLALNILDALGHPGDAGPMTARRLHLQVEALRLAFADAHRYICDPRFLDAAPGALLDPAYGAERARLVDPDKAMDEVAHGFPPASSDTVYFCIVDPMGNACSMVNSVYKSFGTGITPEGLGFSLQNRADNFSMEPGHPNALGPGKRTYHTIIPGMALREDGSLFAPFGVMGGFMQPQGHLQVVSALADDGLDPQAALDRLRFCLPAGSPGDAIALEEGIDPAVRDGLRAQGHKAAYVRGYERAMFGRGQVVVRDPATGWLAAGSDARGDGLVHGF